MTLLQTPIFYVFVIIFFITTFILTTKYAKKKLPDNPYLKNKKIREIMEDPNLLKEKIKNTQVTLSDGKEYKVSRFIDNGKEIDLDKDLFQNSSIHPPKREL